MVSRPTPAELRDAGKVRDEMSAAKIISGKATRTAHTTIACAIRPAQSVPRIRVLPTLLRASLASPHGRREWPSQRGGQKPPPSWRLGRGCRDDTFERGKPWSRGLVACLPHVQRKRCALPMPASKQPPPGCPSKTHSFACLAHHDISIACERPRNGPLYRLLNHP